jgi:hypothetical protein
MLNNENVPTKIIYIIEYEDRSETIVLDARNLSNEQLLKEAAAGQKAAVYELRARIAQNSPEDNTDKI